LSLSELRVHAAPEEQVALQQRQEHRQVRILVLILAGTTLAMAGVEAARHSLPDLAWHDFLIQAFSLCPYLAATIVLALDRRRERSWIGLITLGIGLLACALGNWPLKAGLPHDFHLSDSGRTADPRLLWGLAFFLVVPWLIWLGRRYPAELRAAGMEGRQLPQQLLFGLLTGLLLSGHLFFSASFSGAPLVHGWNWRYFLWILGYEAGLQTWAEELFFRGFLFSFLHHQRGWGFWRAAIVSAALNLLLYLPKQEWRQNPLVAVGVLFYVFAAGMLYAGLYRRFRSIWPSFTANLVFDIFAFVVY